MTLIETVDALTILALAGCLVWAAVSDVRRYTIPDWAVLGIALVYPIHVMVSAQPVYWLGGLLAGGALFFVGLILFSLKLTGGGDVKLLAALGLWAGLQQSLALLLVMTTAGGVLAMVMLMRPRLVRAFSGAPATIAGAPGGKTSQKLPYGVAIAAGGLFVAFSQLAI